jgi:hypothetical protein
MQINNKTSGILIMVITAFLWSIAGLFIKMIDWNPFSIACARWLSSRQYTGYSFGILIRFLSYFYADAEE